MSEGSRPANLLSVRSRRICTNCIPEQRLDAEAAARHLHDEFLAARLDLRWLRSRTISRRTGEALSIERGSHEVRVRSCGMELSSVVERVHAKERQHFEVGAVLAVRAEYAR